MFRPSKLAAAAAVVVLGSTLGSCAPRPRPAQPPLVQPAPEPPPVVTPPPVSPAPLPPVSIGPRPEPIPEPAVPPPPPPPRLPAAPPTAPPVPPGQRGRFVVLNFDNADVETVVHAASEILGFNYVLAPDVRGKVTVQTSGRIPQEDVFGVLLAVLELHGFTAVKSGNLYKIVRIEGARERAVPTIVGPDPDPTRVGDEVITQIVPVRYSSVTDLSALLRPLISTRGTLIAHREANVLIITDMASNVRRLLDIVRLVDVEVAVDELQIIPIRYADAADLATILNQLFASGRIRRAAAAAPGAAPAAPPPPTAPGTLQPPTAAPPRTPGETVGGERTPLIIAERRSNSLIVHARKVETELIRKLISQLDINIYGGRRVFIYYAESAKSKDLAATLNAIYGAQAQQTTPTPSTAPSRPGATPPPPPPPPSFPSASIPTGLMAPVGELGVIEGQVRFIADETTNAVIVTTFPRSWPEIEATIKQLDRQPRQVLIEVLVAEITLNEDLRLGVDWAIKSGKFSLAQQAISPATPSTIAPPSGPAVPINTPLTLPGPGLTVFAATSEFLALLNTFASENLVNVLSNPHVMTSENKKAVINVSTSTPIVTAQQVPLGGTVSSTSTTTAPTAATTAVVGTQSVEYRDAGVILTVTPRIGERGTVALDVKQEVNDIGVNVPPTNTPQIIKREAETSVVLVNNQTLVLGGLIRDRRETQHRGIPYLKDIPILGYLFGARVRTIQKTELLILITPRVIGTALDAARITDEMRRGTPELENAIRRAPRQPTTAPPPAQSPPTALPTVLTP